MLSFKEKITGILAEADIRIDGKRPWDMQVRDERLYSRIILRGSIGLGEAYMDGWWDCQSLDGFFFRLLRSSLDAKGKAPGQDLFHWLSNIFNRQSPERSLEVGERHYDIGNELYEKMLDPRMTYSCGYWEGAKNLDEAEENKLDLICRKLGLKAGQKILDIGCGWGSFAKYAAEKYGVHVTGITISKEQAALAEEVTRGLNADIKFLDYRKVEGVFDHIVSVGMFEHVGTRNYRTFMKIAADHLRDDGLFLLHTIGANCAGINSDPWIDKYIFPNGVLPTPEEVSRSIDGLFIMEDWHNFGTDYDKTLMAWQRNFETHWPELSRNHSERFRRMWNYYLLCCAGAFRARKNQLWQIVFSKGGLLGGYRSVR